MKGGCGGELVIEGVNMERVNKWGHLGTVLDNKLAFKPTSTVL